MLNLILGTNGTGKSEYLKKKAIMLAKEGKKLIFLVPDQMSFQTECEMLYLCGEHLYSQMKVMHFGSLCENIFENYGGLSEKRIDESSKNLVMAMAISACADNLSLYKDEKKAELISLMITIIDEFKSSKITSDNLLEVKDKLNSSLSQKIYEIALIYESYNAIMENSFLDPADNEKRAFELLNANNYFENTVLIIDGFDNFDNRKLDILSHAFSNCNEVFASVCLDELYSETTLFSYTEKCAKKLVSTAKKVNCKVTKPVVLQENHRHSSNELKMLEKYFFRDDLPENKIKSSNIKTSRFDDIYEEIDFVCATIRELVQNGKKYSDITVICRDSKKYIHLLQSSFEKWNIKGFFSAPKSLENSPLVRLVLSCFNILDYGFNANELINIAKTNLCGLSMQEISDLENYLFLWNIDKAQLRNEFTKSPFGFSDKDFSDDLTRLEEIRKKLVKPIIRFKENCKNASGKGISFAIYKLLQDYNVEENLLEFCEKLDALAEFEQAQEQERIWNRFISVLDDFASVIGEKTISHSDYGKLLYIIFSKNEILNIPQSIDSVIFGTADNLKRESDIVFLIGCAQDEFPKSPIETGVLNNSEREFLIEQNIDLNQPLLETALIERYYAYMSACSAREKLFVSYHLTDGKNQFTQGEMISRFLDIFDIEIKTSYPLEYFATQYDTLFSSYAKICTQESELKETFLKILLENPDYSDKIIALNRVLEKEDFSLSANVATELFRQTTLSPSQIDNFHKCKFWYFCNYGLKAKERKVAQIDVLEYGTVMHYIFEKILENDNFKELSKDEIEKLTQEYLESYIKENMGGREQLSHSDKYRFVRMKETALVLIERIIEELSQSEFYPEFRELKFGETQEFPALKITNSVGEFQVKGTADRVDTYEKDGIRYVRIVDYKTGSKSFKFADVLNGTSLQMLIYLSALAQVGYAPAGVLYLHSKKPIVPAKKGESAQSIEKKIDKKLCMDGVVLENEEIIRAMEPFANGKYIPVSIKEKNEKNENGEIVTKSSFNGYENILQKNEFDLVFEHTKKTISNMLDKLLTGDISAMPLTQGNVACGYCPFDCVCQVETPEEENINIKKDEALQSIKEKLEQ